MVHYDKVIKPYIIGVETSRFSLRSITEIIRNEVQTNNYVYCDFSSLFLNSRVTVSFLNKFCPLYKLKFNENC